MGDYLRVIPRDLFNEANLLKCYGALWIALDNLNAQGVIFEQDIEGEAFRIHQNEESGGLTVRNVTLYIRGRRYELERPLNSRRSHPLYATPADDPDADPVDVLTDEGVLSDDMRALVMGKG